MSSITSSESNVLNMSPAEKLQQLLLLLNKKREEIESEIKGITEFLLSPQPSGAVPGLKGNLVDSEGYPRADLDIHMIRIQRNRLAHLQTDHQTNMKAIEKLLPQLHALYKANKKQKPDQATTSDTTQSNKSLTPSREKTKASNSTAPATTATSSNTDTTSALQYPIARVEKVDANSPGKKSGLQVGDRILCFGTILRTVGGMQDLKRLSQHLMENENKEIIMVVLRGAELVNLRLIPSKWEGRGLLGCYLVKED